jgi:ribosome-associated protein
MNLISYRQTPYSLDSEEPRSINNAEQLKDAILKTLEERRALNVKVYENHPLAKYIIIAEHLIEPSLRATASHVSHLVKQNSIYSANCEGINGSNWVILDFQDLILHLFTQESSAHYSIANLIEKHQIKPPIETAES